jgi:hypothetical protein
VIASTTNAQPNVILEHMHQVIVNKLQSLHLMFIELNSLADIQHELTVFTTIFLAWDFDIKPTSPTPLTPVNWKCFQFQLAQTRSALHCLRHMLEAWKMLALVTTAENRLFCLSLSSYHSSRYMLRTAE